MKILFLTRKFWPSIGGVEKHTLEVSKILTKMGHSVKVIAEADSNFKFEILNFKSIFKYQNITIFKIPITTGEKLKKFQIWSWLGKNRGLLKDSDIIHCHDVFFWYLPFRFLFPKKKVFITFHGWEGKFPPALKAKLVRKISEKLAFGNICVGDFIKKWYGTKPDFVTYGGANLIQNSKFKIQNYNLKLKILFIGRLEEDTGLPVYLKALAILKNSGFKVSVEFAGDGGLRKEAEKYGRVLGFVGDLGNYIQNSDFIFTSGYLAILEAMIRKKLIFSVYDNPLKEDYLKLAPFSKWIIIESSPEQLAQKISYYFESPKEEKEMTEKAFDWAKEQSWKKVSEIYINLWQKYL
ncbi:hypothetical protein COT64_03255 [Candidatus Shapirobacteria bacterium CG09_land_8_20_14_0_10_39_12]|uniref:Glycosyltransferase subfamily 4-like N-terminal domain-containing protein n=1 Tax=Candidatus Shapirobacteria bacterium CG09_land_8_20_14_0_10_39_12 TaxID=1974885 RepID=A0A2H0WNY5_9BACT|nr:MAG: hypothetical protein COT64_03255 [Candidatus Shapirobacteria bacterium CG09_land_8_20_14_0_10_39_12]